MDPILRRTLGLTAGTAITRDTRDALSRLLPPDVMRTVNREANRPTPAVIQRIYRVLAETRAPLQPFIHVANPGAEIAVPARPAMGGVPAHPASLLRDLVSDPNTPAGRSLLYFIRHLINTGAVNAGDIEEILYVPNNVERAVFREMPRFKTLLRQILQNRDYQNLGEAGTISGPPYAVAGSLGRLGRINEQIANRQQQLEVLRTAATPPADADAREGRLMSDIATLEGKLSDMEGKKQELRDQLDVLNDSAGIMTRTPTIPPSPLVPPWNAATLSAFTNNLGLLQPAVGVMRIHYSGHAHALSDALDENSAISRRAKWINRKPASRASQTSALALRQLVEEYGYENVRYSNEAELNQFTDEMYARLTSDQPTPAGTPSAGPAGSPGAAPGTPGAAPGTPAVPGATNPTVAPSMPGSGGAVTGVSTPSASVSSTPSSSPSRGFSINPINWVRGAWRNKGSMASGAVVGGILIPVVGAPLGALVAPWVKKYFVDSKESSES